MMQDRLAELGGPAPPLAGEGAPDESVSTREVDVEAGGDGEAFMTDFFAQVGRIKADMTVIRKNVRLIEEMQGTSLAAISTAESQRIADQLDATINETNKVSASISTALKEMEAANKSQAKNPNAETRIRVNMHGTLTRKFVDLMAEYQEVQTSYKAKNRERMERQYKIVNPDADEEKVDQALDSLDAGGEGKLFADQIISTGHVMARNAVADIQERHREILMLEASIAELHQLFLDMAVLVDSQGELLDQIEFNVHQAVGSTEKGVVEMQKAVRLQKFGRKKMCTLMGLFLIIILVLLVLGGIV